MKLRKRMIAAILVAISILNSLPAVYEATGTEVSRTEVSVVDDLKAYLPSELEYGTELYQFDKAVLTGVVEEDEVYLVAEVKVGEANDDEANDDEANDDEVNDDEANDDEANDDEANDDEVNDDEANDDEANDDKANAGETVTVSFTNFRLEGEDAENYELPEILAITHGVVITKRIIKIAPATTSIYYGEEKPKIIDTIADYSHQLVKGDVVEISAQFAIKEGTDVGPYDISIVEGSVKCSNDNYAVELDETVKFEILKKGDDSTLPIVENMGFKSDTVGVTCSVNITDTDSGIAEIKYRWDNSETYILHEFEKETKITQLSQTFQLNFEQADTVDENKHTLHIKVTDNAGNVFKDSFQDPVGSDMNPPNIGSVEINNVKPDDGDSTLNLYEFGTFSNYAVEIVVGADDISEDNTYSSGIKEVTVNGIVMESNTDGKYVLRVSADKKIENMQITVTDNAGWSTTEKMKEFVKEGSFRSSNLYVEDDAPTVNWTFSSEGHTGADGTTWYGIVDKTQTFTITAQDNVETVYSGIHSITITDDGETWKEEKELEKIVEDKTVTYKLGDLADDAHTIAVSVVDNAGNKTSLPERTIGIDSTIPVLESISVISPEGKEIDGIQWFKEDDVIKFRIDASDSVSGIKSITVKINDEKELIFEGNNIHPDENGCYVEVEVDTKVIKPDESHKYVITGKATDFAGNESEIKTLVVWNDLENPSIDGFTIEKKNTLLDKVLNILTFGIYTNDDFIVKAYTSDAAYDSGIDYAQLKLEYNGKSEVKDMTYEGDGVFSCEISGDSKILYENISVTVFDKYGKETTSALKIEGAAGIDDVLVEQIVPVVSLELPASDSVSQSETPKWYSKNKEISFSVQDIDSGIRDVSFKVNEVEITTDKNGIILPKTENTQMAAKSDLEKHTYIFDTDYISTQVGESGNGKYVIELTVTDNAGNVSVLSAEYFVDKGNPQIDLVEFAPVTSDGITNTTEFVQKLEYGFFFKTDTVLTIHISDAAPSAGLNKITYRLVYWEDGTQLSEFTGSEKIFNGKAEVVIPKDFKGQVFIEAFDNVNNSSGEMTTKAYVVDNTEPMIQITENVQTPYCDAVGNPLYVENNSFTVEITDEISGIREIGYAQSAEQHAYDRKVITIQNVGHQVGTVLEDGWVVAAVENNMVTKVVKTFSFSSDDNNVSVTFDATDNALNTCENVKSATFTVDKTNPIINISFREDEDTDLYYHENRVAYITVIDRNITPDLIHVFIENTFGAVPTYTFTQNSITEYTAVVEFSEGDYTFSVNGVDLGERTAQVNYSGGNENIFFVDKTAPQVEENFSAFTDSVTEDSFNMDKTVEIKITEHNFDPTLVNLQVLQKEAGADHISGGFVDVTDEVLRNVVWNTVGDVHTVSFTITTDGVYQLVMTPVDLAGNTANQRQTVVFEIDKTVPVIVSRNGKTVSANDTGYLDVYNYYRQDEAAPTIEFDDVNIDHINYVLIVYVSEQTEDSNTRIITPVRVYLEEDSAKTGTIMGNKFTLPDFVRDGVYALELVAVDKAGNESEVNVNTYIRLVNQDVLAYIMDSDIEARTGLYSFQYENGTAISKRPDNFEDIEIFVLAENESDVEIVLRDNNGTVYNTSASATVDSSIYGMQMYRFTLESEYFKENFQSDIDIELCLSVINDDSRIDLGKIHIDNIAPTCDISDGFDSWKWYCSENKQTITIFNISEQLDVSQCKIYDNGKEVAFNYSETDNTMTFTLEKGWHNVGIVLSDMAGNTYNIQEKANIYIGYFWLWVITGTSVVFAGAVVYVLLRMKKRKQKEVF